jgi:phosphoenolpyruvate synthase/pyruvate phosphate dikinase
MGRKRLDKLEVKNVVTVRLSEKVIREILEHGSKQEIIERAVLEYLNKINGKNNRMT